MMPRIWSTMFCQRALLLAVAWSFLTHAGALAEEAQEAPSEAQIRSWIAGLANPGPEHTDNDPFDGLAPEQLKALEPVILAHKNLTKHFMVALPYLIESLGDRRFSYPQEHPLTGLFNNRTVGDACREMIERKILLQNPYMLDNREKVVRLDLPIDKDWYASVKGKNLFEIQVDALDRILKEQPPDHVPREKWDQKLQKIRDFREKFVAAGKAVDHSFGPQIEGK